MSLVLGPALNTVCTSIVCTSLVDDLDSWLRFSRFAFFIADCSSESRSFGEALQARGSRCSFTMCSERGGSDEEVQ